MTTIRSATRSQFGWVLPAMGPPIQSFWLRQRAFQLWYLELNLVFYVGRVRFGWPACLLAEGKLRRHSSNKLQPIPSTVFCTSQQHG